MILLGFQRPRTPGRAAQSTLANGCRRAFLSYKEFGSAIAAYARNRLAMWSGIFSGVTTTTDEDCDTADAGRSL